MKFTDSVSGVLICALGIALLTMSAQFPSFAGQPYGASLFPSILGTALVLCGLGLGARDLLKRRAGSTTAPWITPDDAFGNTRAVAAFATVLLFVLAQILLGRAVGFAPLAVIGLFVLFRVLHIKTLPALALSLGGTAMCWFLFARLLLVPLPRGIIGRLIDGTV